MKNEENSLKWPLILSKKRVEMNIEQIEKHMTQIWEYLNKLI